MSTKEIIQSQYHTGELCERIGGLSEVEFKWAKMKK